MVHLSGDRKVFRHASQIHYASSYLCSRSTHNQRIERLWVEVGSQFGRRWRAFFERLEDEHHLDPKDPNHLWLLHYLFLDDLNMEAKAFQEDWNFHPISSSTGAARTGNKSPNVRQI